MLFGEITFRREILDRVNDFCDKKDIVPIYGAVVGGISKGLQYCDSDYDTRFLYLSKEGINRILIPDNLKEKDIVTRYYPDDETVYEWIPFWEMTSFLHFLINPCIDGKVSSGLYNIVGWTLGSPYNWDPYGLQSKLMPLVNRIFIPKYLLEYHLAQLDIFYYEGDSVIAKDYFYAVYSALCMNWVMLTRQYPPTYIETLITLLNDVMLKRAIHELIQNSRADARKYIEKDNNDEAGDLLILHTAHYHVSTTHNPILDGFIDSMKTEAMKWLDKSDEGEIDEGMTVGMVDEMYHIIDSSMHEESVKNIS